jgi:hypothetical protein
LEDDDFDVVDETVDHGSHSDGISRLSVNVRSAKPNAGTSSTSRATGPACLR